MEASDTLHAEFRRYDPKITGVVPKRHFLGTLSRFGVDDATQQMQLVRKFLVPETGNVNYSSFMHYFGEIQRRKSKVVALREKPNVRRDIANDAPHAMGGEENGNVTNAAMQRENAEGGQQQNNTPATPTHKRPCLEPLVTTTFASAAAAAKSPRAAPSPRTATPRAASPRAASPAPSQSISTPPQHIKSQTSRNLKNTWIPLLSVKSLSTLFDKLFSLDPKCTGAIPREAFISCLSDLNVIPRENIPRVVDELVKEERHMRSVANSPLKSATADASIDYNYFIKRILDVAGGTKQHASTPRRDLFEAQLPHFGDLPQDEQSQHTPNKSTSHAHKKLSQLKQLINHKFYTKCNTLKEAFRKLDVDNRGFVTYPELKEALEKKFNVHVNELWMQKLFDEFDAKKQGVLYFEDIRSGLNSVENGAESAARNSSDTAITPSTPTVASLVTGGNKKSVHFEPNDFEENAQFSSEEVRHQLSSSTPAGKSTHHDHSAESHNSHHAAVENQSTRNALRDRMHHESDPFNQEPYTPTRNVSIKPNYFANVSSADHPLIPSSWEEDAAASNTTPNAREIRRDYDLARLRKFISEKALAKTDNLKDLFMYMDTNKDGRLGYDEFRAGLQALGVPPLSDNQFNSIVKIADQSQNGFIEYDELCNLVENPPLQHTAASTVTPLENSIRRRKFITPNLSKEQYQQITRKGFAQARSKPILPNNDKVYQKMLRDMKKSGFYQNFKEELMNKFEQVDQEDKGSVSREVLKLALRESAILVGNSDFENLFDELDPARNDAVPYKEFIHKIENVDKRQKRQLARAAPDFADFSLSTRQKQSLQQTLALYAHTKRAHKDDITVKDEHLIDQKSLVSALKQLNVDLTNEQMDAVMQQCRIEGQSTQLSPSHTRPRSASLNNVQTPVYDTNKVVALLTNRGVIPSTQHSLDTTRSRTRIRSESLSSITPLTPATPTSKIQRNDETASPVHIIKQIGDKLHAKNTNLHAVFRAFDKSNDGKLNADELKQGIKTLGLDVQPRMLEKLLKHFSVSDDKGINFEQFAKIFRAPNQSFVLADRRSDFVSDLIRDKFSRNELKRNLKRTTNPIMMEDQFRNILKEQNPHAPQWVFDRAVRVARSRDNGKVDVDKFISYLVQKDDTTDASTIHRDGRDLEGFHLMDTQQSSHDRAYNPRAKGAYPAQDSLVNGEVGVTTIEDTRSSTPKRFSKRVHLERYESPPVTRYWGYPKPQAEFEREEAELARRSETPKTEQLQRNRSANYFEHSLRHERAQTPQPERLRTAKRMSPLKAMKLFSPSAASLGGSIERPHSASSGVVGRRRFPQKAR